MKPQRLSESTEGYKSRHWIALTNAQLTQAPTPVGRDSLIYEAKDYQRKRHDKSFPMIHSYLHS